MSLPEHKIRSAIKAYLDGGGAEDFYIISKKDMVNQQKLLTRFFHFATEELGYEESVGDLRLGKITKQYLRSLDK